MEAAFSDSKFVLRNLWRSPLFAAVAILSLALGIGAHTAIFSLLDKVLLRSLPVKDPEQLVHRFISVGTEHSRDTSMGCTPSLIRCTLAFAIILPASSPA